MILRLAEPDDALSVAHVHVRAWQTGYRGLLPDAYLDGLRAEDRASRYDLGNRDASRPQTIVALDAGAIRGFATVAPARDADLIAHGELCALYVDPDEWGRGIGAALVAAARAHLYAAGFRDAVLWLLADNARGERFYRSDRWLPDGQSRTDMVWGISVDEVRYCRALDADVKMMTFARNA